MRKNPTLPKLLALSLSVASLNAAASLLNPAKAQVTVEQTALEDVFGMLDLTTSELVEMPLNGAGQKIPFTIAPAPTGLKVEGTSLGKTVEVPVEVDIGPWRVLRGETPLAVDTEDTDGDYKVVPDDSAQAFSRTFIFKTIGVHYTDDNTVGWDPRTVEVTVTLSAGQPATSFTQKLERDVKIPRLGIPKILALFRHTNYATTRNDVDGFLLILLPSNTPLSTLPGIKNFLDDLQDAVTNLSWAASFAGAAARIGMLRSTITGHPHTQVRIGGRSNLYDIKMINHAFGRDTHASDAISSLMFLADKGYRSYFFNNEHYRTNEGYFILEAGEGAGMVVEIPTLHQKKPTTSPAGRLIPKVDSDGNETFGNKISGIRFSAP